MTMQLLQLCFIFYSIRHRRQSVVSEWGYCSRIIQRQSWAGQRRCYERSRCGNHTDRHRWCGCNIGNSQSIGTDHCLVNRIAERHWCNEKTKFTQDFCLYVVVLVLGARKGAKTVREPQQWAQIDAGEDKSVGLGFHRRFATAYRQRTIQRTQNYSRLITRTSHFKVGFGEILCRFSWIARALRQSVWNCKGCIETVEDWRTRNDDKTRNIFLDFDFHLFSVIFDIHIFLIE